MNEKKSRKVHFNSGVLLMVAFLLAFGILISVVIVKSNEVDNVVLPDFSNEVGELMLSESGNCYEVKRADFVTSLNFSSTIKADAEEYILSYQVDQSSKSLGEKVKKGENLNVSGDEVLSSHSGTVVAIEDLETSGKQEIYVLSSDTFYVEFYISQANRDKISYSTSLDISYSTKHFSGTVTQVGYTVTNQGVKISASVDDEDGVLLSGYQVTISIVESYEQNALTVDSSCISQAAAGQMPKVCVAKKTDSGYEFSYKFIRIVAVNDSLLKIEGLDEGELIFVAKS